MSEHGIDGILAAAYNPVYGARPIRRFLEKNVGTAISRMLVSEELPNHSVVHIDGTDGALTYRVETLPAERGRSRSPKRRKTSTSTSGENSKKSSSTTGGPNIEEVTDDPMQTEK